MVLHRGEEGAVDGPGERTGVFKSESMEELGLLMDRGSYYRMTRSQPGRKAIKQAEVQDPNDEPLIWNKDEEKDLQRQSAVVDPERLASFRYFSLSSG